MSAELADATGASVSFKAEELVEVVEVVVVVVVVVFAGGGITSTSIWILLRLVLGEDVAVAVGSVVVGAGVVVVGAVVVVVVVIGVTLEFVLAGASKKQLLLEIFVLWL